MYTIVTFIIEKSTFFINNVLLFKYIDNPKKVEYV